MICRFTELRTAHSKRQISHMNIENLSTTHAFDYIVFRVKPGYRCADFAGIIFRKIGRQKQRAKCWHNRSKFEQNTLS